jgi:hypothetical protein
MGQTLTLYIPCEPFDVVLSADDAGPTEIEKAVLLFLAAGDGSTLDDVLAFLGLSEQLTMDLITKLWQLGYILVDANQGKVRLDPYLKDLVDREQWKKVQSSHQISETVSLMRELVSGQVVGDVSSPATPLSQFAVPILITSSLGDSVSNAELARTALRNLRQSSALVSRSRSIRAAIRRSDDKAASPNLGWLGMDFEASADPDLPGSLTLRAAPSDNVHRARIGPGVAGALTAWALDNGDHPAVAELLGIAERERRPNRASLASRVQAYVPRIAEGMADPLAHQQLLPLWVSDVAGLTAEVEALELARGEVLLHTGEDGLKAFLRRAAVFEHQMVLAAPSLDYDGLLRLDDTVFRRLRELSIDASTILLWGGATRRQLPRHCADYLDNAHKETADSHVRRFYSGQRSSRIAGALAVMDGRRALYSNESPLDSTVADGDFGFVLEIAAEPPSPIVRQMLELLRERAPDFEVADQIDLKAWVPQPERQRTIPLSGPVEVGRAQAELDAPLPDPGDADASVALKARLQDLRETCRRLAQRATAAGSTIHILSGASLYQQALDIVADDDPLTREATLWLGFGRDESAPFGVPLHRALAAAIGERVKLGRPTVVLAAPLTFPAARGRTRGGGGGGVDIAAIRTLAEKSPQLVTVLDTPDLPGHFLCGEERFLAAPGGLASPPVVQGARLSSRLIGMSVASPALCADFRAALVRRWPELASQLRAVTPRPRSDVEPSRPSVVALVEAWREPPPRRRRARLLAATIGSEGDRSACVAAAVQTLLDLTNDSPRDDSAARLLRADTLAVAAAHAPPDLAGSALAELAEWAWRERRWHEAALIVAAAPDSAPHIPPDLAAAAAAASVGLLTPDLSSFLAHDDPDRWTAGVALSAKAVLFNADEALASALEIKLLDPCPPGFDRLKVLAEAVLAYWNATMDALDPATIRTIARKDELEKDLRAVASAFASDFRQVAARQYNNSMLNRVVPRVYSDVSGLKPVADLIREDGTASWPDLLKALTAALGNGRVDVVELADTLFEKSRRTFGLDKDEPIVKGRGKGAGIRDQAHDVLRRALKLRDAIQAAMRAPDRAASEAMLTLLKVLRSEGPTLSSATEKLPADALASPLLSDLQDRLAQMLSYKP